MGSYYLAPALTVLRHEIDLAHPARDKTSDGWIGDASHAAHVSDHNPDWAAGGVVRAIDVDKDGINTNRLLATTIKDDRIEYVIWAGFIYSRAYGFRKRVYTGVNGHYHHVHISLRHGVEYENNIRPWGYAGAVLKPVPAPVKPKVTVDREKTKRVQTALEVRADGFWGGDTDARARLMRTASRAHAGYPHNVNEPFDIKLVQTITNTKSDGAWGTESQKALVAWIKVFQKALGVPVDGSWGSATETAFLITRNQNLNHF